MEVCGSEVLISPMTNEGEHSDLEKLSSIDPCSMTASMELKVGITREGNQHSQQLPSPQEHLNNVPEPGDIPSRSPSMATEADASVGHVSEAEHNGHLGDDEDDDDKDGSHGDEEEEEEERDGQDQSYDGYEPTSQQQQPDDGDEEIQCDDDIQDGDQCDDDTQEGDINLESEMDDSVLSTGSPDKQSGDDRGETSDSNLRHDHLHSYDSEYHNENSVQLDVNNLRHEHKYETDYDNDDSVLVDDNDGEDDGDGDLANDYDDDSEYPMTESNFPEGSEIPRRGRGRPRGSKNRCDGSGRGRGRGFKFRRLSEDRTCTAYDLRNIPDPFNCQRRGRPRSRFIVDLGEQNHEAWTKAKEELNISDAELTTLLLSLLESRRDQDNKQDSDTMLGLVSAEYGKWKDKFSSQVSMLSHYSSIHNTNCCTCLGIKYVKKKYIPAGTGKRGRPRKYPPPVGYGPGMQRPDIIDDKMSSISDGPGMQRPDTIDEDGNIFEPQIILKDGMIVKAEPGDGQKVTDDGSNSEVKPRVPANDFRGEYLNFCYNKEDEERVNTGDMLPRQILSKEELEKRREYYNNHKNKIKYVCHYCQVHFYHKPNFDYHISKLEGNGKCRIFEKINNLFLCETCGEGFSWREKLEKHLRLAEQHGTHNQKELLMFGDFQCNMCGKTFNKRTTYLQHVKWHEDREDIPCVICGTMFKQTELRRHLMEVHSNDSLPCSYCGKLFTSRKYLEKHEIVHQGGNFPCPECGKTFSQKSNMQQHLKTHMMDKDYACEHCQQTYNQRMGLCQHLRKHFGPAEFHLECELCGQYFNNDYNLKVHKKRIHNMHIDSLAPDNNSDHHSQYLSSPLSQHMSAATPEDDRDKGYNAITANTAVKNMLGMSIGGGVNLTMKQEEEHMNEAQLHMREAMRGGDPMRGDPMRDTMRDAMRDTTSHMNDMRHLSERRETPNLMGKDPMEEEHMRLNQQHHSMASVTEDALHMPQDLTRMTASQSHMSDDSGRMSAAPPMTDLRNTAQDSPGRLTDTPAHMTDNFGRMAVENFGRMTSTPGGYLAEHLRRMAENQSRMSDMSHYDERDNYSRLGDNLRSMSRGSAGEPMGRLGENLGRMSDNLSHMGVIRPTQTPSSTPQWPPHMQNHSSLESMNQSPQASQHTLYPLPFWPYDPSLRQYHH